MVTLKSLTNDIQQAGTRASAVFVTRGMRAEVCIGSETGLTEIEFNLTDAEITEVEVIIERATRRHVQSMASVIGG